MTAAAFCLTSAAAFFLVGLAAGVWKYLCIATTAEARAPFYVDTAHRASLLYAFACGLLSQLVAHSAWSSTTNLVAAAVLVTFFAAAVLGYVVHGVLRDTDNQLARPHRLGTGTVAPAAMVIFMVSLMVAELGGFTVIFVGYLAR
ncbi:MAG: hypothetical protein ABIY55_36360 [Kofleriaceae bacterium]